MQYWIVKGRSKESAAELDGPSGLVWTDWLRPGRVKIWHAKRPLPSTQPGDRIVCWESAPYLAAIGLAEVVDSDPSEGEPEYYRVALRFLTEKISNPVGIEDLKKLPELADASFLRGGPPSSFYPLEKKQFQLIFSMMSSSNAGLESTWSEGILFNSQSEPLDLDLMPRSAGHVEASAREGRQQLVTHLRRERDPSIVESKKRDVLKRYGRLDCEICEFNFQDRYGVHGSEFCEVHHRVPLANLLPGQDTVTKLDDLAIVCSNCHRILHRTDPLLAVEDFRMTILNGSGRRSDSGY